VYSWVQKDANGLSTHSVILEGCMLLPVARMKSRNLDSIKTYENFGPLSFQQDDFEWEMILLEPGDHVYVFAPTSISTFSLLP
jgi:hypothetical protein